MSVNVVASRQKYWPVRGKPKHLGIAVELNFPDEVARNKQAFLEFAELAWEQIEANYTPEGRFKGHKVSFTLR